MKHGLGRSYAYTDLHRFYIYTAYRYYSITERFTPGAGHERRTRDADGHGSTSTSSAYVAAAHAGRMCSSAQQDRCRLAACEQRLTVTAGPQGFYPQRSPSAQPRAPPGAAAAPAESQSQPQRRAANDSSASKGRTTERQRPRREAQPRLHTTAPRVEVRARPAHAHADRSRLDDLRARATGTPGPTTSLPLTVVTLAARRGRCVRSD